MAGLGDRHPECCANWEISVLEAVKTRYPEQRVEPKCLKFCVWEGHGHRRKHGFRLVWVSCGLIKEEARILMHVMGEERPATTIAMSRHDLCVEQTKA